jgi:Flp pilus assembly protein TadD
MMAIALQARDPEAALRHLLALRRLRPNDHRTHNDLAVFYLQRGQPEPALRELEIARQDPYGVDDPILDLNQALVYMTLNQPRNAEPFLRRYLAAVPDDVKAHFLLGQLLWQLGRRAEAKPNLDFARANHFRPPGGMTYPDESPEQP